ncbi:MAG TPA: histidine kinase [Gaiellaceae bacterium]|nr:histidine kinase [Gaiellaceae bacterium]
MPPVPGDEPSRHDPTDEILAAEQDERRRIALFLHDGPVQSLAGVALMLDAAVNFLQRGESEQAGEVLDKALSRTRTTIGELRNLSFNLEPVILRDHGLGMALQALGDDRAAANGIAMEVDAVAAETLSERTQAALYAIVREALEGAIRRGPPTVFAVRVRPAADEGGLEIEIFDDAPGERRRRSLEVLRERARTLGAAMHVDRADVGTTMRLVLPTYPRGE